MTLVICRLEVEVAQQETELRAAYCALHDAQEDRHSCWSDDTAEVAQFDSVYRPDMQHDEPETEQLREEVASCKRLLAEAGDLRHQQQQQHESQVEELRHELASHKAEMAELEDLHHQAMVASVEVEDRLFGHINAYQQESGR